MPIYDLTINIHLSVEADYDSAAQQIALDEIAARLDESTVVDVDQATVARCSEAPIVDDEYGPGEWEELA